MSERDALYELMAGLRRHAPGGRASTLRAIEAARPYLPANPRALDLGCGVGRSAELLRQELGARVVGLDLHRPFLQEAAGRKIDVAVADMARPPFAPATFDLVWSEGALYQMGIEPGLQLAAQLLRGDGIVAFTELCWFAPEPPADAQRFWAAEYPGMRDVVTLRAVAEQVGYEVLEAFRLPRADWEKEYYGPLRRRVAELAPLAQKREELRLVLTATEQEIRMFDRHGDSFGYLFLVLRKTSGGL